MAFKKLDLARIKAIAEEAAKTGPDLNKQTAGGGDYTPPAEGATRLRFVGYVELGVHTTISPAYGPKTKPRAEFTFELSGPKHEPKKLDDGRVIPHRIIFREPIGTGAKNNYSKLFKEMVKEHPGAKNFVQLLGEAFRGKVVHRKFKKRNGQEGVSAELKDEKGYTITGVTYEDPDSGELRKVQVGSAHSDYRVLVWDEATVDQWDSLFIEGTYDDGNTKNKIQEEIKAAENFIGSPVYEALIEADRADETEPAEVFERGADTTPEPETPAAEEDAVQEGADEAPETVQETPKAEVKAKAPAVKKTAPAASKPAAKPAARKPAKVDGDPLQGL